MTSQQRFDEIDFDDNNASDSSTRGAIILNSGPGASSLAWPVVVICALFLGFLIAVTLNSTLAKVPGADPLHRFFASSGPVAEPEAQEALVITANSSQQLAVVATLSPRGLHPLLASSGPEVLAQIRAHAGALKVAVVDATLPDYAFIANALKDAIPAGGIIILKGSDGSQEIGPMLLTRL